MRPSLPFGPMIDLKALREHPHRFRDGAAKKRIEVQFERLLRLDEEVRTATLSRENLRAEQRRLEKDAGPQIGKLKAAMGKAPEAEKPALQRQLDELLAKPAALKEQIAEADAAISRLEPELQTLLLTVPLPPDDDVPVGTSADDNVEVRRWDPATFKAGQNFAAQRGFKPRTHQELCDKLGLVDFPRGVRMSGTRSYVLTGQGMLLHQAILRFAFDTMVHRHGFAGMSVPVLVREECMIGTGFFPAGREQAYHIPEKLRAGGKSTDEPNAAATDLYLTGTGEVGLMGLHQDEILDEAQLPLRYVTVSTCFRREAGAAGKDTSGLYRVHVFDKVEQVVITKADSADGKQWHQRMIGYVEQLLQDLELPYRLLQCCSADLGPKNANMIDIECWMPGRGEIVDGSPTGAYGETHSASRLDDFQCRRLNMRYRPGGAGGKGPTTFCHSLNNTVAASPRLMIPLLEVHQQPDGSVAIPAKLRPYMNGIDRLVPRA